MKETNISERQYLQAGFKIVQQHPRHGQRPLIDTSGHGQFVWVGEYGGSLLIYDVWHVMGYKDGSLKVVDPDTLVSRVYIPLDLDMIGLMGFDQEQHFLILKHFAGQSYWQGWQLPRWILLPTVTPVAREELTPLTAVLTSMQDLPKVTPN